MIKILQDKRMKVLLLSVVVVVSVLLMVGTAQEARANFTPPPGGTPLYTWGNNANGQLGHGDYGPSTQRLVPTRVGGYTGADNWIQVATATGGAIALNAEGHIYTWGALWTAPQMGQGDNPDNPGTGLITVPTRVGDRDNWVFVTFGGSTTAAINDQGHLYMWGSNSESAAGALGQGDTVPRDVPTRVPGDQEWASICAGHMSHAITTDGHLYSWGRNDFGQLGQGTISPFESTPGRVGADNNWKLVSENSNKAAAINTDGEIFMWGRNNHGQLGQGDMGDVTNRAIPTQVGTATNWVDIVTSANGAFALNSDGEIYSWGQPTQGRLGRPITAENPQYLPGRVGERSDWVAIGGGNGHVMAMTADMELYAWGINANGQLGIDSIGGYEPEPVFVLQAYGLAGFSQTGAGSHSMALIRTTPIEIEATLTKHLQVPQATTLLTDKTFTFTFERHSFNDNTAQSTQVPNIPNRTITITNSSPSSTDNGITTFYQSIDMLEGIEFTGPGVFRWIIEETQSTTPPITTPSNMVFSQAQYELSVWVEQASGVGGALSIYAISIVPLTVDNNSQTVGTKVEYALFTNTYMRTTLPEALTLSKTVVGQFADLSTNFDFEITLTRTAFCETNTTFTGQIFEGANPVGAPLTFESGVLRVVQLTHNQRIVFDELVIGTSFNITELAAPTFRAAATLTVGGTPVSITPNTEPNTDLTIGSHLITQGTNSATFTNTHVYATPTGLGSGSVPLPLIVISLVFLVAYLSFRSRRNIERLPVS